MNTIKIQAKQARMIAHRGLSGLEKENTCAAFVAAGNRESYFGIETDVHRTADGKFVIFHDDDTARVGLDRLVIEDSTFQTLRSLQLTDIDGRRGRADLVIPTLEEYVSICKKYEKVCVLELKNRFSAEDVYRIAAIIEGLGYLDHVIFISFVLDNLLALRQRYPLQPAQYLLCSFGPEELETLKTHRLDLDLEYTAATREIVEQLHAEGLKINCWTADTAEAGRRLAEMGVDYITSNILEGV